MDRYLKDRIENITDEDFWSSVRPLPELKPALEAARAGKRARAYSLLGKYHAQTTAAEAQDLRGSVEPFRGDKAKAASLRRNADRVLRHEIQGWHDQTIKFGPKIDFNADFGRSGQYGFHYLGWLPPVLHQYLLTGEERYRDCFLDVLLQYYDQRNKLNWRHPNLHPVYYELGARAKIGIFLPAYASLVREKRVTVRHREAFLKLLLGMARSLFRLQKGGYRPGNWQIVGAESLLWMGCVFPELKEAAKWRERGLEIIMAHAKKDFFTDGCHGERCWGYGWMSLSGMVHAYQTGVRYGQLGRHRRPLERVLKGAFQWFAASASPTLEMLNYGDGGISPVEPVLSTARKVFPGIDDGPGLLGVDRGKSRILRPSGYAFMVADDRRNSPFMSINFGRWGGGHTHHDLLDFSIWCYGEPIIEEVGRFGSYDNPLDPFFRSEQAHNQIVIEHTTMNRREHEGQDVVWHSTGEADFFSAYHLAYESRAAKVQRQVVFVKPDYWVLYDVVDAPEKIFQVSSYLHAPRPFEVLKTGTARVRGSKGCLVAFACPEDLRHFTSAVDYSRADCTEPHGKARERHRLVAKTWRNIGDDRPITFATLLMPFRGKEAPRASIQPLPCKGAETGRAEAFEVTIGGRKDVLAFNPARLDNFAVGRKPVTGVMAARVGGKWVECPGV